tara:strand:- start:738 stop:971 length:234 start_codon:yes stop_codon:yes gene_type:complete
MVEEKRVERSVEKRVERNAEKPVEKIKNLKEKRKENDKFIVNIIPILYLYNISNMKSTHTGFAENKEGKLEEEKEGK